MWFSAVLVVVGIICGIVGLLKFHLAEDWQREVMFDGDEEALASTAVRSDIRMGRFLSWFGLIAGVIGLLWLTMLLS